MGATEGEELVERLAAFPSRLAEAARVAGSAPAGEWGPAEVVRHLIAVEAEVHRYRLADVAAHDEPRWSWTEPGLAAGFDDASLDDVLAAFAAARAGTVDVLTALDEAGWARSGIHATFGRLDVAGLVRLATDHDEEHLAGMAATG
jgi:hypothetical protein